MIGTFAFPPELHDGMRARLQCVVTQGDMPIVITWLKDDQRIPKDLTLTIRQDDDFSSTLTFPSIHTRHGGKYMCIASNEAGTSNFTAPLVVDVPPRWVVQPGDRAVVVKSQLRLDCGAEGNPEPQTVWKKAMGRSHDDYADMNRTGAVFTVLKNGSLLLPAVTEADEGYYLCHVTNGIGMGLSKVVYVTVQAAASFEEKSKNETVRRGDTVRLECKATGDSPITITWQSSVREFSPANDARIQLNHVPVPNGMMSEMTIDKVERKDSGTYTCTARNTFGQDEMFLKLIVLEPPEAPENVKIADHGSRSVKLLWSAPFDGSSPISKYIIQYKNGSEEWASSLPNTTVQGHETSAVIRGLQPGTAYSFRVMAANDLGAGKPSSGVGISTTEEAPSSHPRDVQVETLGSDKLRVTCKPPLRSHWNGEIVGYVISYRVHQSKDPPSVKTVDVRSSDMSTQTDLENLRKYTKYSITVQAYNRMGRGPPTPEMLIYTAEDVPSAPPNNFQCTSLTSQSVQMSWEPPPADAQNGQIQGYVVYYGPMDSEEAADDASQVQTLKTPNLKETIFELHKFTNYSLQVVAYTNIGNGAMSEHIYCRTKEDVPSPPANIKVLTMSSDAIHVTWKPPVSQNGVIIKYNVYMRALDENDKQTVKHVISSPPMHFFEAKGLTEDKRYEFWVTASTRVGEGESTRVMSQKPTFKAPAAIASFSDVLSIYWKENLTLECRALGMPTPSTKWFIKGEPLTDGQRLATDKENSLFATNLQRHDAGNYSCQAENMYGSDDITYIINILAPPLPPTLTVVWETVSSIGVMWKTNGDGGSKIKGFLLAYKQNYGKWQEVQLSTDDDKYALDGLLCGTHYQLHIRAVNKVGEGEASSVVMATTKGSPPLKPRQEDVLMANATMLTLRLSSWPDGGCPIQYFVVKYRLRQQREWILASNNLAPQHDTLTLSDLRPETWYHVHITAHNEAGSDEVFYEIATLAYAGGTVGPGVMIQTTSKPLPFYREVSIIVPVIVSAILTLSTIAGICLCMRRRKRPGFRHDMGSQEKKAALPGGYDPTRTSASLRKVHPPLSCDLNRGVHLTTGTGDDVCPYATFRLPLRPETEDLDSYQLQTFPLTSEKPIHESQQRCDFRREDLYSKANKRSSTKSPEEEELYKKESSVDLRPFLSLSHNELHLSPTSGLGYYEPVTGSPDVNMCRTTCPQPTDMRLSVEQTWDLYAKRFHRFPDLLYHGPDSNSSDEMSEDDEEEEEEEEQDEKRRWGNPRESQIDWSDTTRHSYQSWRRPSGRAPFDKRVCRRLLSS